MRKFIAALLIATAPSLVSAEGFTISDLGSMQNETSCVDRAARMFREYNRQVSVRQITPGNWSVMAFDLKTAEYDAVVSCNYGPNSQVRATMVVYSSNQGSEDERTRIVAQLKNIWGN
ncbi:MAG: hypothetical protein AAGK00_15630 [Pseudomonadota bacterium]